MRRLGMTLAIALLVAGLTACGAAATPSPSSGSPAAGSPAAVGAPSGGTAKACAAAPSGSTAAATVTIKNSTYETATVEAKVGDVVAWTNGDSVPHTATMDDATCDTGQIANGATAMLVFTAPGTYTYHCTVHPTTMKDVTVEVK